MVEVLEANAKLFRGAEGPDFMFMYDNVKPHKETLLMIFFKKKIFAVLVDPRGFWTSSF